MQSKAKTVKEYLAELPPDRREIIQAVRQVILANLDDEYEEGMSYGGIGYYLPHRVYPPGYHCDPKLPLPFAGLGSQKHYISLGLMCSYDGGEEHIWLKNAWAQAGKKLDMGKCCIRFRRLDDIPLDVIGEAIRRVPAQKFIAFYESAILSGNKRASAARSAKAKAGSTAKKKKVAKRATSAKRKSAKR